MLRSSATLPFLASASTRIAAAAARPARSLAFLWCWSGVTARSLSSLQSAAFLSGRPGVAATPPAAMPWAVRPSKLARRGRFQQAATSMSLSTSPSSDDGKQPTTEFVKLADPAPGSPFHYAFPVHDLDLAKKFYGDVLGCAEGRSSTKWQDFSLNGHQIVCHWVGNDYRCQDYYNPVDGDEVPVPHTGLALTEEEFHTLAKRVRKAGIEFIIEPHLRFKGQPGEQWTMFFKDPSGNNLEFKAMTTIDNLFAKYNVAE